MAKKLNVKTKGSKKDEAEVKVKSKKGNKEAEGKKSAKKASGVEAMAAARAAAKAGGKSKTTKAKTKTFDWKAPESLGTSFPVEVTFVTERDGMPGGRWRIVRFKGKYPNDDDRKQFNMAVTDPVTFAALVSRLSLTLFHPTGKLNSKGQSPRLKPKTQYRVLIRCSRRKADDTIVARVNKVWTVEKNGKGKIVATELDKKDLDLRKIRKINKHLPAAFLRLAELPETTKRRKSDDDED